MLIAVANAALNINVEIVNGGLIDNHVLNSNLETLNITGVSVGPQQTAARIASDPCSPGTFSLPNSTSCLPCPAGSASNATGATACAPCAPGYWAGAGQISCTPCDMNFYSDRIGAATCVPCYANAHSGAAAVDCNCNGGYFKPPRFLEPMLVGQPLRVDPIFIDVAHCTI